MTIWLWTCLGLMAVPVALRLGADRLAYRLWTGHLARGRIADGPALWATLRTRTRRADDCAIWVVASLEAPLHRNRRTSRLALRGAANRFAYFLAGLCRARPCTYRVA